ncbi:XisI protein [Nodosilinea sp. LEGE 06152]|uniref:XisI protein n=1 Tax=Nodosilinea sp. LEGE 06152 TaxID=2777966 RepID=UPI0018825E92|nr:XisI protein [Nodosilinea sp. LEGE 06152]MBE9160037.1 XisI protein [Nodosilinea sp. LEGE 06152]
MATLDTYSQYIQTLLTKYGEQAKAADATVETQLVFDTMHHHYQLLEIGWAEHERIYNCILHLDIKNNKIWIQRNTTDVRIAEELVEMGVPKSDIVLGLQAPYKRPYTDYGVA